MRLKDLILHLRFPFSVFLMPVYWLAVGQQTNGDVRLNGLIFVVLHLFVYPASNAYNSYFDEDTGSIGGLENPPPTDKKLWWTANVFDGLGLLLALSVGVRFAAAVVLYILVSRAYSYRGTRLKRYPVVSWLIVGLFQGGWVFFMTYVFGQTPDATDERTLFLGIGLATTMLWAVYPLTQVYQHEADAASGDKTISRVLGIKGTFRFSALLFGLVPAWAYFLFPLKHFVVFLVFTLPVAIQLLRWMREVWQNEANADFRHTMRFNLFASLLLNLCFITLCFLKNW